MILYNISENPLVTIIGNNCHHMCSPCLLVVFFELLAEKGTSIAKLCCILQRMFLSIPSVPTHVGDVLEARSASWLLEYQSTVSSLSPTMCH